jgi:hypothetical protein
MGRRNRDNISGVEINNLLKALLIPGLIVQWLLYMNPGKGFKGVARSTRAARSPLMTYVYSVMFWLLIAWILVRIVHGPTCPSGVNHCIG